MCGEGQAPAPARPEATPTATATVAASAADDPAGRAAALAGTLGDEDLVGQVLMPYAYGSSATTVTPVRPPATRPSPGSTPRPR